MNNSIPIINCSCPENLFNTWSGLMEKYLIPFIGCLGLLGNLTAIFILRCPQLKSTFHQSLLTLTICDILFLLFILADIFIDMQNVIYIYTFPYFWNPLKNIVMSWETFLTMSIATERFLAVCRPLFYRRHKLRTSSLIYLLTFILPGLVFALLINIPKFFEVELFSEKGKIDFRATQLRMDENYIFYYTHWTRLLVTGIVPILYLVITNTIVIIKIREGRTVSFELRQNTQQSLRYIGQCLRSPAVLKPTSTYLGLTLTAIVLVYLICNLPRLVLNLVEYQLISEIYKQDQCGCSLAPWWISSLIRSSHLLLTINSSVNFLIYISFSKRFKKVLKIKIQCLFSKFNY